jgi:ribose 5-phosphate isomerase B
MRVAIAADHGGYQLKTSIVEFLAGQGYELIDLGASQFEPQDDYPRFARAAALAIRENRADRAIILCGSGVGASIAAAKVPGVRAAVCHDSYSAHQGVEHDDMNALCLGARIIGEELAKEIVGLFLRSSFSGADRHRRRLAEVKAIEKEYLKS